MIEFNVTFNMSPKGRVATAGKKHSFKKHPAKLSGITLGFAAMRKTRWKAVNARVPPSILSSQLALTHAIHPTTVSTPSKSREPTSTYRDPAGPASIERTQWMLIQLCVRCGAARQPEVVESQKVPLDLFPVRSHA